MIKTVHSFDNIQTYFQTIGSKPIAVLCDDGNIYVCKYDRRGDDTILNEYLGACFLRCCGIPTPNIAWVEISPKHNPNKKEVEDYFLGNICFGSLYLSKAVDFSRSIENRNLPALQRINRIDLLQISLFDLWVSHQDRNDDNTNLLLDKYNDNDKDRIIAIDNASIFNFEFGESQSLKPLRYEQSMMSSAYLKTLYGKDSSVFADAEMVVHRWLNGVENCRQAIDDILLELHDTVLIDKTALKNWILDELWAHKHLKSIEILFYNYLSKTFPR